MTWNTGFDTTNCGVIIALDDFDTESTHTLSVDSDGTVPGIRCGTPDDVKNIAMVRQFTTSNWGFIHSTTHHIN